MRIAITTLDYMPNRYIGAELYDHRLAKALQAAGHDVEVFTSTPPREKYIYDGVKVNYEVTGPFHLIITHLDSRPTSVRVRKAVSKTPKLVGIFHNEGPGTIECLKMPWDGVLYNSRWAHDEFSRENQENHVLMPPVPQIKQFNSEKDKIFYTAFQANTGKTKGGSEIIEELAKMYPKNNFRANQGGWGTQIEKTELKNLHIFPHEPIKDEIWSTVQWLLLPSNLESWSMTASEAIAHGVPVITYDDLPGVRENLGEAAVYLPRSASIDDFARALENPPAKAKILAKAVRNYKRFERELASTVQWLERIAS